MKGLNISTPLLLSGTLGYRFGSDENPDLSPTVETEIGVGGGKIMIGFDGMGQGFGFGLKGSFLTTWLEPVGLDSDQQYLGVELQMGNPSFIGSLGGYGKIEGDDDSWISTLSIGIRF
ncbi:hypothetical protein P3T73_18410 [Kiritimatiellota bacterium B12222]|nr:hypothetical protein P3T73_18410 [Kiritimatiellota bacterium B12222]